MRGIAPSCSPAVAALPEAQLLAMRPLCAGLASRRARPAHRGSSPAQRPCASNSRSGVSDDSRSQRPNQTVKITRQRPLPARSPGTGGQSVALAATTGSQRRRSAADTQPANRSLTARQDATDTEEGSASSSSPLAWWEELPSRYKLVAGTAVSFVICNLDKASAAPLNAAFTAFDAHLGGQLQRGAGASRQRLHRGSCSRPPRPPAPSGSPRLSTRLHLLTPAAM
jgi:hypothetical protein